MSFSGSSRANRLLQSARTVPVSVRTVIAPPVSVVDPIVQSESYVDPDRVMQPLPERLVSILDGDARVREAAVAAADAARRIETDRKERLSQRRRELLALKSAEQRSNVRIASR